MKNRPVAALVLVVLLGASRVALAATPIPAAHIEQRSEGQCSPPIVNNSGQVTIVCANVEPQALRYLEDQLSQLVQKQFQAHADSSRTIRNLNDLTDRLRQQAEDWARRYHELQAYLNENPNQDALVREARALTQQGEFDRAEAMLKELSAKEEAGVLRAAAIQYSLGDLEMLRFAPARALPHFEKAFRYVPDNPLYAHAYGKAAYLEGNFDEAKRGWTTALELRRKLAARDPDAYQPDLARTLNNLANLLSNTGPRDEAKTTYIDALALWRELATRNPGAYRSELAGTLNNLGNLQSDVQPAEAEAAYAEALTIYRDLDAYDPGAYRSYLAVLLNNLGNLQRDTDRLAEAEATYADALKMQRELTAYNPGAYRSDLANTLNNLGRLQSATGRPAEAQAAYAEALAVYRELAEHDPGAYRPYLANTLYNLGLLLSGAGRPAEAEAAYTEALSVFRELAARDRAKMLENLNVTFSARAGDLGNWYQSVVEDHAAFNSSIAHTLYSLGHLLGTTGRLGEAEDTFAEALAIYRELAEYDSKYQSAIADTLYNLGYFQRDAGQLAKAEASYVQARSIYQDLSRDNPEIYAQKLAWVAANLKEIAAASSSSKR